MGLIRSCVILGFLATVGHIAIHMVFLLEPWAGVHSHAPGPCHLIDGINHGSEDMETLPNGLTFITSGLKATDKVLNVEGKIFLYDLNEPELRPEELQIIESDSFQLKEFAPHGIGLKENQLGALQVYVVNHPPSGGHIIEKFEFDPHSKTLVHIKTIEDEVFAFMNDLTVTGDDQFYVTNSFYARSRTAVLFELFLGLRWGQLVYFDGTRGHVIEESLMTPNGIALSLDKQHVYVSASFDKQIRVYERQADSTLSLMQVIDVSTKPDNLNVCPETGDIWIGANPSLYTFLGHEADPSKPTMSQVLRLTLSPSGAVESLTEVYADSGHRLFGASVAVKYKSGMLVGTVFHKLMYCDLKYVGI